MTKVTEVTYYETPAGGLDLEWLSSLGPVFKRLWNAGWSYGEVSVGVHAGTVYGSLEFESFADYARLQDTWMNNQEWLAFLNANAHKMSKVVGRDLVTVQS
ncbi:MAG: hypothetical protein RL243_824 [Actinomycetota bacterium]|jgi:hypothetical protein